MITLSFPPNLYLDRRQPEWLAHERGSLVSYDPFERVVKVSVACAEIATSLNAPRVRIPNTMGSLAS